MEDIAIPMLHGNMEDIAGETSTANGSEINDSSVSTQQQYERERRITIDYALLPENLKDVDEEDIKKTTDKLTKIINDLQNTIQRIQAPNMKVCNELYKLEKRYVKCKKL
jgi:structural maintenance of chromosome 1